MLGDAHVYLNHVEALKEQVRSATCTCKYNLSKWTTLYSGHFSKAGISAWLVPAKFHFFFFVKF